MPVPLDPLQDFDARHVGQIQVEQDQKRFSLVVGSVIAEKIGRGGCTAGERNDLIIDAGSPDIALNQAGVTLVVLDHDDDNWPAHRSLLRLFAVQLTGSVTVKLLPLSSSDATEMVPPSRRTRART